MSRSFSDAADPVAKTGAWMHALMSDLYPVCRSITGEGVRATLRRLQLEAPIEIVEIESGAKLFDWTAPKEWTIRDAYVANAAGDRIIDFREHNLHVVSYSRPVRARMTLAELRPHLHSDPAHPDWIPYRTSYYQENWGFCLSHAQLLSLEDGVYEVVIDSSLEDGALTYGECFLPGASEEEVLLSAHICHPSLANDNLSGIAVAVALIDHLRRTDRRFSYRILFVPGTIGAIAWLARNEARLGVIRHGLVLVNLGDGGPLRYKRSRRGNAAIDRVVAHALAAGGAEPLLMDFSPYGYDERQFCSPGIDLPVGSLMRTPFGQFPEYHTSADNLDFVSPDALAGALQTLIDIVAILERDRRYRNLSPMGEPQLGRRGLYEGLGGRSDAKAFQMALLWVLNLSDGDWSLLDIAERSGVDFTTIAEAAAALERAELLAPA